MHAHWTAKDWSKILWSDETWITAGRHRPTYVTRQEGEEIDPTCIVEQLQRKKGWMFWGCFSGLGKKGPCLFWEKEWGTINGDSYRERIIPLIEGWIRLHPEHQFMQDNAPAHASSETLREIRARGINVIFWPPFSPDLNPIEWIWGKMKDWIEEHYSQEDMSYDQLRRVVKEAWDAVSEDYLEELILTMPDRCRLVIEANGGYIKA